MRNGHNNWENSLRYRIIDGIFGIIGFLLMLTLALTGFFLKGELIWMMSMFGFFAPISIVCCTYCLNFSVGRFSNKTKKESVGQVVTGGESHVFELIIETENVLKRRKICCFIILTLEIIMFILNIILLAVCIATNHDVMMLVFGLVISCVIFIQTVIVLKKTQKKIIDGDYKKESEKNN